MATLEKLDLKGITPSPAMTGVLCEDARASLLAIVRDEMGWRTRSIVSVDLEDSSLCSQGCRPEREQLDGYNSHGIF